MTSILFFAGVFLERTALATGLLAAAIAVGGFPTGTQALVSRSEEPRNLQRFTAAGGVLGVFFGASVIVIDAITS